jgi:hypothetical protein
MSVLTLLSKMNTLPESKLDLGSRGMMSWNISTTTGMGMIISIM